MSYKILLLNDDDSFRKTVLPGLLAKGLHVVESGSGQEAFDLISTNQFNLVIIDNFLPDTDGIKWITRYRVSGGIIPIIFISANWLPIDIYHVLTRDLNVAQIIHKPIIPPVFIEQVYSELSRPQRAPLTEQKSSLEDSIANAMEDLTKEYLQDLPGELERIGESIAEAKEPNNTSAALRKVLLNSHKLRGTAGSFGLHSLGEAMGRIEDTIRTNADSFDKLEPAFWAQLDLNMAESLKLVEKHEASDLSFSPKQTNSKASDLPSSLQEPESETADLSSCLKENTDRATFCLLVIDEDKNFLAQVEEASKQSLVNVLRASTVENVLKTLSHNSVNAILVDIKMAAHKSFELARTIRDLTGEQMPLAFISEDSDLDDKLRAAHMGASLYLSKPIDPDTLEDAIQRLMILGSKEQPRVLVLDDDRYFAKRVSRILFRKGMETQILSNPAQIIEKLQAFAPEVLILEATMPYINGFDICKMLRTIPRWQELPVIFASNQNLLEYRIAAFACGADDYLPKPIVDEELATRVSLRVERSRLLKERSERDPLTGVLLRKSFMERFNAALSTARRTKQPISLIIFDLDQFKSINDTLGHLAGDAVLAGLGRQMLKRFRVEDLRGRWGGDEFILALVGSDKQQSLRLMRNFLDEYAGVSFTADNGVIFHASMSAGIAGYPSDCEQSHELLRVADQRLYAAKQQGRNCVVADSVESLNEVEKEGIENKT